MRLDTQGLRALIADNPEIEVELGKEVLNNIKSDIIESNIKAVIDKCIDSHMEKEGGYYSTKFTLSPKMRTLVESVVREHTLQLLENKIKSQAREMLMKEVINIRKELREEMKNNLKDLVTPEMAKEILKEKLLM